MKTTDEITLTIKIFEGELQNAANERNFCIRQAEQLAARINYLSGKIDALKELTVEPPDVPAKPAKGPKEKRP